MRHTPIRMRESYSSLYFTTKNYTLIGVKEQIKTFDLFELDKTFDKRETNINLIRTIPSIHSMCSIQFNFLNSVISYGIDGKIIIYDIESLTELDEIVTHSVLTGGVKHAIYFKLHRLVKATEKATLG